MINGQFYYDISDHLPIFVISKVHFVKKMTKKNCAMHRKRTKQNIESLNLDLAQEEWVDVLCASDVYVAYAQILKIILYYYHKNIPFVK